MKKNAVFMKNLNIWKGVISSYCGLA
jgi:hypothetical protein